MKPELSAAQREREYSPSSCIGGNYQPHIEQYRLRSLAAKGLPHVSTPAWDLFLPTTQSPPLLVFIHGGYWQELSKADSLFAAPDCVNAGIAFAAIEYTLAPKATVLQIVDECCAALEDLRARARQLGFNADRIVLAGSSAGAHLAAMVARAVPVAGVILVSGIYDLTPLIGTSINEALGLDAASAVACSPLVIPLHARSYALPAIVCWGEIETSEFKRQSKAYADLLACEGSHLNLQCGAGVQSLVQRFEVAARNHFDIILDLANPASQLGQATHALLQTAHADHR